jgi:flagellar basal body-associated protein FliL
MILTVLLTRPVTLILLAMSTFYLWVYIRHTGQETESSPATPDPIQ